MTTLEVKQLLKISQAEKMHKMVEQDILPNQARNLFKVKNIVQ